MMLLLRPCEIPIKRADIQAQAYDTTEHAGSSIRQGDGIFLLSAAEN
jgi:hypothetical protein